MMLMLTRDHVRSIVHRMLRRQMRYLARELRRALLERDDAEEAMLDFAMVLDRGPHMPEDTE